MSEWTLAWELRRYWVWKGAAVQPGTEQRNSPFTGAAAAELGMDGSVALWVSRLGACVVGERTMPLGDRGVMVWLADWARVSGWVCGAPFEDVLLKGERNEVAGDWDVKVE